MLNWIEVIPAMYSSLTELAVPTWSLQTVTFYSKLNPYCDQPDGVPAGDILDVAVDVGQQDNLVLYVQQPTVQDLNIPNYVYIGGTF
jgi:hypothetical protein